MHASPRYNIWDVQTQTCLHDSQLSPQVHHHSQASMETPALQEASVSLTVKHTWETNKTHCFSIVGLLQVFPV